MNNAEIHPLPGMSDLFALGGFYAFLPEKRAVGDPIGLSGDAMVADGVVARRMPIYRQANGVKRFGCEVDSVPVAGLPAATVLGIKPSEGSEWVALNDYDGILVKTPTPRLAIRSLWDRGYRRSIDGKQGYLCKDTYVNKDDVALLIERIRGSNGVNGFLGFKGKAGDWPMVLDMVAKGRLELTGWAIHGGGGFDRSGGVVDSIEPWVITKTGLTGEEWAKFDLHSFSGKRRVLPGSRGGEVISVMDEEPDDCLKLPSTKKEILACGVVPVQFEDGTFYRGSVYFPEITVTDPAVAAVAMGLPWVAHLPKGSKMKSDPLCSHARSYNHGLEMYISPSDFLRVRIASPVEVGVVRDTDTIRLNPSHTLKLDASEWPVPVEVMYWNFMLPGLILSAEQLAAGFISVATLKAKFVVPADAKQFVSIVAGSGVCDIDDLFIRLEDAANATPLSRAYADRKKRRAAALKLVLDEFGSVPESYSWETHTLGQVREHFGIMAKVSSGELVPADTAIANAAAEMQVDPTVASALFAAKTPVFLSPLTNVAFSPRIEEASTALQLRPYAVCKAAFTHDQFNIMMRILSSEESVRRLTLAMLVGCDEVD